MNKFLIVEYCFYLWIFYLTYSIIITIYDYTHLEHLNWEQAENKTTVYSSRRSTTVTYAFEKEGIRISRKYPGIIEGLNTWLWGIDKKKNREDIFFISGKKIMRK